MKQEELKFLLVDDDAVFRERLALSLRRRGHEVVACSSTEEAVAQIQDTLPDAAVLDLKMPGESGLALVPRLREINPAVKILILTGYGSIPSAVDAIRLGVVDYLTKPADTEQILLALAGRDRGGQEPTLASVPSLDRVEWEHMQRVLADCGHNISQTARVLGIERRTLQRKLQKYPPPN